MKHFKTLIAVLAVLTLLSSGWVLTGQEQSKEEQEIMKKWKAYATPGPNHKYLASFVGQWDTAAKMWEKPGASPTMSKGKMEGKMILGGRYFLYSMKGDYNGMPFEGKNITAYDNYKKKFVSIWIDNFGTGIYETEGSLDKTGKIRTDTGIWDDVFTGGKTKVRMVTKNIDKDKFLFEMYQSGPMFGPNEFKSMEIVYTRKK